MEGHFELGVDVWQCCVAIKVLQHHNRSRQKGHESEGTNALSHISIHVTRWLSLAETQDTKANPGPEGWELCAEQLYQKHNRDEDHVSDQATIGGISNSER